MFAREYALPELVRNQTFTTTVVAAGASTGATVGVDLAPYVAIKNREVQAVVLVSALTTITTLTVAVAECDTTSGTFAAPPVGTTSVVFTAAGAKTLNWYPTKRYAQLSLTPDTTGSVNVAAALQILKGETNS